MADVGHSPRRILQSPSRPGPKTRDRPLASYGGAAIIAAFLLVITGCDPQVDLFKENDLHYSLFGVLNPSADTQFVRVEPLRDSLAVGAPETMDAEVTLTHLDTDRTISLQDSLFRSPDRHNFYTTADIQPTTPYRLVVEGPRGAESRVQTTVPQPLSPRVIAPIPSCFPNCPRTGAPSCNRGEEPTARFTSISVDETGRLVSVRARYVMEEPSGVWSYGHLADTSHTTDGTIRTSINYAEDWCKISSPEGDGARVPARIEVVVAAGSPDWPAFLNLDLETELLPGVASNVEGGVGFVGGAVTDTVRVYP